MILKTRRRTDQRASRQGAATVEFAVIAIPMFLTIFTFFELTRLFVMTSLADDAVFASLREVMIVGATKADGEQVARQIMSPCSARNSTIEIIPRNAAGVPQSEIRDDTSVVKVRISFPVSDNSFTISPFAKGQMIVREAEVATERSGSRTGVVVTNGG